MTLDIFIVSFPRDYAFLEYCLRSIRKFVTGYRRIHVALPRRARRPEWLAGCEIHDEVKLRYGYTGQQITKMRAYRETDADVIAFLDSDHVCTMPTDLAFYFDGKLPQLWWRPFDSLRSIPADATGVTAEALRWQPKAAAALGFACPWFTLEFLPILHYRKVLADCCGHIERVQGQTLEEYAGRLGHHGFGEFTVLGNYAIRFHAKRYSMRQIGPGFAYRFNGYWPYKGLSDSLRDELEMLVA